MQAKGTASRTTIAARGEPKVTHSSTKISPIVIGNQDQEVDLRARARFSNIPSHSTR